VNHRGWLLDSYIEGRDAILWLKKEDGETIRLLDTHKPSFIAMPCHGFSSADVSWLFERHPYVYSSSVVERYSSLSRDKKIEVIEVKADEPRDLKELIRYGRSLPEVEEIYNIGLAQIQWHLIELETPPSSLCRFSTRGDRIDKIMRLDDDERLEPPPFSVLELRMPDSEKVEKVKLIGGGRETVIEGNEKRTIIDLMEHLQNSDPDIVSTPSPKTTLQFLSYRVKQHRLDLGLGRRGETIKGRVLVSTRSLYDMGVAGLSERARFTYAPMGVSHDWEAGKTIDSRQCAEALKMGVIVPPMGGGYSYSSWAWDLIRHDKGGIIFSPKPGLHVNVAALDFESMFPNIIVRKNVSYETVTEDGVDQTLEGFLGRITEPFLVRRLRFKHQMNEYPTGSPEWNWCQQRQSTLKLFLVVYYGYSGCYANRFANVRVFQEINRQARDAMVKALGVAQRRGYEVVYGPFDSLFVKHPEATADDFRELAAEISRETELPMGMERHFRYLVLLNKTTDPLTTAANHYYGKLTDGLMFYRGIEVRRHDTPPYIHGVQEKMIKALLKPDDPGRVLLEGLAEARRLAGEAINKLKRGEVDPRMLVISKRLRRDLDDYSANQPHIVAAMLGEMEEMSRYILVNTKNTNPFMRVMPEHMIDQDHRAYDRRKYASMMRRAAWNILRPFIPEEDRIGGDKPTIQRLDAYF
jgi:DNA polymerase elongation subunit (family B)